MNDRDKVIRALQAEIDNAVYPDRPRRFMFPLWLAEKVLALLEEQETCEDAVSRSAVLDQAQTYGPATWAEPYGSGDMIIRPEDVAALPSVQPVPVARVMTLEEVQTLKDMSDVWLEEFCCINVVAATVARAMIGNTMSGITYFYGIERADYNSMDYMSADYGKEWRCWTSRPTDEQREAVKWDD